MREDDSAQLAVFTVCGGDGHRNTCKTAERLFITTNNCVEHGACLFPPAGYHKRQQAVQRTYKSATSDQPRSGQTMGCAPLCAESRAGMPKAVQVDVHTLSPLPFLAEPFVCG